MDSLPIELIEKILKFCNGNTFCRSSRVSKKWLNAKQNIERTSYHFWKYCCEQEIEKCIFDELNNCSNVPIFDSTEDKCRTIYIQWFRGKKISDWSINRFDFTGNSFPKYENISALKLTGTLLITGDRSGRVLIIDYKNDVIIPTIRHLQPVNDLALIDIIGDGHYEIHKNENYPTAYPSYSSHHHIISISKDSTIKVFPIHNMEENPRSMFEINSFERNFLSVRVCKDLIAVSSRAQFDISLFRLSLPKIGRLRFDRPFVVEKLKVILCRDFSPNVRQWTGVFTFSDLKLKCFCNELNVIACCDVSANIETNIEGQHWKWLYFNELTKQIVGYPKEYKMLLLKGFAFGDGIFFVITSTNRVLFTTDSKTFNHFPIHERLVNYDKILTISLFGSIIAYGTHKGFLFIEHFPSFKRLPYILHYKPLFKSKISDESILYLSITDDGVSTVVSAATTDRVFLFNWTPKELEKNGVSDLIDDIEVIDLSD